MSSVKIVRASLTDLPMLAQLFDQYRIFYKQASDLEKAQAFLQERLEKEDSVIFLAMNEEGTEGYGFTQLYPSFSSVAMQRLWVLNDLYVTEAARRMGVAKQLMERAKEHAIETKARGLTLKTAVDNLQAQALYDGINYQRDTSFIYYNYYL